MLLAGCEQEPRTAWRFALQSAPITLDPRYATDATSARLNRLLYRALVDFDAAQRPVPDLATWRRLSPTHYRFVLADEGRAFHDGTRLSARDVKATYASVLDPGNGSPHRASIEHIARITTPDAETVDFYLERPDPLFPGYLVLGILPAERIDRDHPFGNAPVGSGPFRFLAWPEEGRLRLKRIADGQVFEFLRIKDPTVRVLKLLRGEVDMMQNDLPPELVGYLARRGDVRIQRQQGSNFTYLGFNLSDPVTAKPEVRRAVAHAVDRAAIIDHVLAGAARPASALLPPEHWAGHPGLPLLEYDPGKSRELLARAGYDEAHPAHITYKTSSDPLRIRLATIIQQQLGNVGIEVDLRSYDWGTFYGDIKSGNFQMYSLSWVGVKSPDIFEYVFHSQSVPPNGANRGRFRSAVADRLIESANSVTDNNLRIDYFRQLQKHLLERLPYVPLWYEDHVFVARQGFAGYTLAPDGNYDGLRHVRREATVPGNGDQ